MKSFLLGVCAVSTVLLAGWSSHAATNDAGFVRKFLNYRAKHNISTYRAAKAFADHTKKSPEQILKRYISAAYAIGGATQDAAVAHVIDAFKESGLSHEVALTKVSDSVGQMTDTLDAIYQRVTGAPKRGIASVRPR